MTPSRLPENIIVCPGCGTNLIHTARRCVICGYCFTKDESSLPEKAAQRSSARRRLPPVVMKMLILFGTAVLLFGLSNLILLGLQKRAETKDLIASHQVTATYVATTYVSPTPQATVTFTPGPPTATIEVDIEYTVVEGDSCISIARQFNLYVDSLLRKNDIDCALLSVGTVLKIPRPTATPEITGTPEGTAAP